MPLPTKKWRVGVRVLVEGYIDIEATSTRRARELVLGQISGGTEILPHIKGQTVIAADAEGRSRITELDDGSPIAKKKVTK